MKNIYAHPDGYLVRVTRGGILYSVFIAYGSDKAAALKRAQAERERFHQLYGENAVRQPRSNTGLLGITEVTKWSHGKPQPCFQVTFGDPRKATRRFPFHTISQRDKALAQATACRQAMEAAHV